jgi:glycosyltransferase involved in cell wall biosynthesis
MPKIAEINHTDKRKPLVSICVLTYNHEKFITETLDSLLMQDVNFDVEIVFHDDMH